MGEDRETFEELALMVDVDYKGGFQTSVDVTMVLGRFAHLSIKVLRLSGKARVLLTRHPYVHWAFAFVDMPVLDFKVDSQFQGRDLKHAIPLITQAFRKALQRKHVWPNYKIRYRPLFPNPILQPSPPISAFEHVKVNGTGLEVTVLECTRLNTKIAQAEQIEVFCTVSLDQRPFMHNAQPGSSHCISVMLNFTRHGVNDPLGLEFTKSSSELGLRAVKVCSVESASVADKSGFRTGDVLIAINNVPIRNQLQATRILTGTVGDLLVLVERSLSQYIDDESGAEEVVISSGGDSQEDFVCIGPRKPRAEPLANAEPVRPQDSLKSTRSESNFRQSSLEADSSPTEPVAIRTSLSPTESAVSRSLVTVPTISETLDCSRSLSSSYPETVDESRWTPRPRSPTSTTPASSVRSSTEPSGSLSQEASLATSVQRTESVKIPKLSVQSPSMELRRSRSESEVVAWNEPLDDEAPAEQEASIEPEPERSSLQDQDTKDPEEANTSTESAASPQGPASESLAKQSRRERFQARANDMALKLNAGRAKVNDLLWNRKSRDLNSSSSYTELAQEADDSDGDAERSSTGDGFHGSLEATEVKVVDKSRKLWSKRKGKSKSPSPSLGSPKKISVAYGTGAHSGSSAENSPTHEKGYAISRCTKPVRIASNVMWGQSLHFALDKKSTRYLNVTVHARAPRDPAGTPVADGRYERPTLLGSTSIYVPQIIDDCQLTLSNCHREVFVLRPPSDIDSVSVPSGYEDLSRHAGFDPRLCYGDLTLGFRFFPKGLPDEIVRAQELDESEYPESTPIGDTTVENAQQSGDKKASTISAPSNIYDHKWEDIHLKHSYTYSCGVCRGKIWLKWASRCKACNFVCHNKCAEKANMHVECNSNAFNDDEHFELLDGSDLSRPESMSSFPQEPSFTDDTVSVSSFMTNEEKEKQPSGSPQLTRRRKIANKVSEKLATTWKSVGSATRSGRRQKQQDATVKPNENPSTPSQLESPSDTIPVSSVLDKEFLDSLEGSSDLKELAFEPGNSYNAAVINVAKTRGQCVFSELGTDLRKAKINQQIDVIQAAINETTAARRSAPIKSGDEFDTIDIRLQALALLMLHYCSGLTDCFEREDAEQDGHQSPSAEPDAAVLSNEAEVEPDCSSVETDQP